MDYQVNLANGALEWPYPVNYEKINHVYVDVLVVGGGLSGSCAAIAAARRGAKVAVADKGPIRRSGCGGAGMDHYNAILDNPDSTLPPDEGVERLLRHGQSLGHRDYIAIKGTWDALMELEKLGLPIRDEDGDFEGAATLDKKTKLFKAYDYTALLSVKLRGGNYIKSVLYDGMRKEGVKLFDRVMITSLLTEGGKQGARVAGATGFSMETGEFYVYHAKSVVIASGYICSCWIYNLDITGNSYRWDPNEVGDGFAMAWNAGAKVFNMHHAGALNGVNPLAWPRFGAGHPATTWFPCSIVDNNNKEIPWEDREGRPLKSFAERNIRPEYYDVGGKGVEKMPELIKDLPRLIHEGEYELPLWADFAGMPEEERRSIWGLMIGNEGKTRFTLYDYFLRAGFNPDRDMIMCPIMAPEGYKKSFTWFKAEPAAVRPWRTENGGQGELASDWNLMTSLDGVYCVGAAGGLEGSSFACSSGFYAGNRAVERAKKVAQADVDEVQLNAEIERVYAPTKRVDDPDAYVSWKELWGGSARAMQQCCADYKTVPILEHGLKWLKSIRENEMQQTYARNPHELARVLEGESRIVCSEAFIHACIAKIKAEEAGVPDEMYVFNHMEDGKVITDYEQDHYWLKAPYAPNYRENYERIRAGEKEEA